MAKAAPKEKQASPSASAISRSFIVAAIEALEVAVKNWEESTAPELIAFFNSRQVKMISAEIEIAAAEVFELCDGDDIHQDAWDLVLAVDEFEAAIIKHAERMQLGTKAIDPSGGNDVWGPYGRMVQAKTPRRRHKMEPIQQLLAEKVPRVQIAKMYGFIQEDGSPDLDRLQREVTTPGSEFRPSEWIHPTDRKYDEQLAVRWSDRQAVHAADIEAGGKGGKKDREAPETLEELILQGVNPAQISKMKGIPIDDVRELAGEMGVALDSSTGVHRSFAEAQRQMADERQKQIQRSLDISKIDTHVDLGANRDARILAMHDDGVSNSLISAALIHEFPAITPQGCHIAIQRAKESQQAESADKETAKEAAKKARQSRLRGAAGGAADGSQGGDAAALDGVGVSGVTGGNIEDL